MNDVPEALRSITVVPGESQTAGFVSWKRLADMVFPLAEEIKQGERVVRFELSRTGINYFVTKD